MVVGSMCAEMYRIFNSDGVRMLQFMLYLTEGLNLMIGKRREIGRNVEYEQQRKDLDDTRVDAKNLRKTQKDKDKRYAELEKHNFELENSIIDLQTRSMNNNLICYGIPEPNNDENVKEDCESLVKELISTHINLDTTNMEFVRAHRLGSDRAKKPRGIVVKFQDYKDREKVRKRS
ncbi:uncharacterized protein LOC123565556 [Mercenaria mercenaria]|uniref:uncharacterized protein LOC123565556 n=1 Tax=Mercenaria mercenaria TaxID=6596 RepID=UPI001E1DEA87|nr:uncharacterized protein LOC123565556 [Mercenaria mercenaria]